MVAMRVRRHGSAVLFGWQIFIGASALGCSGEEDGSATERYCDAVCARGSQCGDANVACIQICIESADVGPLRDDAAENFSHCFETRSCGDLWLEETFSGCWDEMQGSVAATEYGRRFCVAYASHIYGCGYDYGAAACEADYGIFTDEALEALAACTERPCEELEACTSETLWGSP